jgi:pimeloyl-ACP methyl ester carboxylesterase
MKYFFALLILFIAAEPIAVRAQYSAAPAGGPPTRTTYVRLANTSNAILVEPETPNANSHIGVVVSHPGHLNNFDYFIAPGMARRGYRVLLINYYGAQSSYYEYLTPMSLGVKYMRALAGIDKVLLVAHSTGGTEATFYEDVAENGPKSCQEPDRIYKCTDKEASNLPTADALILMDANTGAIEHTRKTNPAVDPVHSATYNEDLEMFSPRNGYDPKTGTANFSPEFLKKFFAAQAASQNKRIDDALARLAVIDAGKGDYKNDEPFSDGASGSYSGSGNELAYIHLIWKTHAPHKLLTADGSNPVGIISLVKSPQMRSPEQPTHSANPELETVRSYLSQNALRLTPDYHLTEDNMYGVVWRSTPASLPGNIMGIHVPTLIMAATCSEHLVSLEISYDNSPAKDKEFVGVEGATHFFTPCRPEYGDTFNRAFDYVDAWVNKPGRLEASR